MKNMKLRSTFIFILIIASLAIFSSCSKLSSSKKERSSTTGWKYNDPDNGGFEYQNGYKQDIGPGLIFIEGGTFTMGRTTEDVMKDWNNIPRRVTVASFYIDETEVRNVDYLDYLHWLKRVYTDYPEVYRNAIPDTLVWRRPLAYNEPYVNNYLRHPAYAEYPVVGVSWEQATDFCAWRTNRVNELRLIKEGVLKHDPSQRNEQNFNTQAYLAGQYEGAVGKKKKDLDPNNEERNIRWSDGILLPNYRLPTEAEWEYAATALIGNTLEERISRRRIFPWNGHWTRNENKKYRGKMMANFARSRGDYMGVAGDLNDSGDITVDVKSYWPNDFGLYCMAGNVNEWVADVYRPMSSLEISEFNPYRGNVFKTAIRDQDGKIAEKDSLGRIKYRKQTDAELANRNNYSTSDNRNYRDGDIQSSLGNNSTKQNNSSKKMYGQKKGSFTSLIGDDTRVYKGGSWKDRAYWMAPGARRFLNQKSSSDDIGFRCAMVHVGNPKKDNHK